MGEPNYGLSEKASSYVQINIFDTSVAALSERGINLRHIFETIGCRCTIMDIIVHSSTDQESPTATQSCNVTVQRRQTITKSYHEEFGTYCHNPYVGDNSYGTEQDVWVSVDDYEDPSQSMSEQETSLPTITRRGNTEGLVLCTTGDIKTLHGGSSFSYSPLENQCGSSEKGQIVPAVHKKNDAASWRLPINDEFGGSCESGVTSGQNVKTKPIPTQFTEEESPISSSRGEPVQSSTKASVHATATCFFTTTQQQTNVELANPSCVPTLPSDEGVSYLKSQFQEQKSDYTRTFSVEGLQNLLLDYQQLGAEATNIASKEPVTPEKKIHGTQNEGYITAKCRMPLCWSKILWNPKMGRGRLLEHARIHWRKDVKRCRLCSFKSYNIRRVRAHHFQDHRDENFRGAISTETEDDILELKSVYETCYPEVAAAYPFRFSRS